MDSPGVGSRIRFHGYRGGIIAMHRALAHFVLDPWDLIVAVALVILFLCLWAISLPRLCRFWTIVLGKGMRILALPGALGLHPYHLGAYIWFTLPYPMMEGVSPSAATWWWTAGIVLLLFVASLFFPPSLTPVTYLLRVLLVVQTSALVYFIWAPARFPHTPDSYMEGLVTYGIALISFVPVVFGLTYYVFDFGLPRKALLTILTMLHLSLFLPLQVLLQAIVLQKSVLFMPLLYIVFGLPIDVLIIIAFYSWGMSWASRTSSIT
ncbi:MAG: hypothetical protein WBE20_06205 [Candidatus Acidiferrales bacterium]